MAVLVTVLAYTAIQSHTCKPLTNFLVCTSLQLPSKERAPADKEGSEDTESVSPHTHASTLNICMYDVTWGISHNTSMPASLSALDVALDGSVSVVWDMCEVGHVQWLYS